MTTAPRGRISPAAMRARCYRSIQKLLALPPETRLWMCHDYKAPGRDMLPGNRPWRTSARATRM